MLLAMAVFYTACERSEDTFNNTSKTITELDADGEFEAEAIAGQISGGIILPADAIVRSNGNGISFDLPSGYELIGVDNLDRIVGGGGGSYTCTCNSGQSSGCSPFKARGEYGCLAGGCTTCEGTASNAISQELTNFAILDYNAQSVGVTSIDGLEGTEFFQPFLMEEPRFAAEVEAILDRAFKGDRPSHNRSDELPDGYAYKIMQVFGVNTVMALPNEFEPNAIQFRIVGGGGGGISCDCGGSGSGCTKKKKLGIEYCDGDNCTSCTLNGVIGYAELTYSVSVSNGRASVSER